MTFLRLDLLLRSLTLIPGGVQRGKMKAGSDSHRKDPVIIFFVSSAIILSSPIFKMLIILGFQKSINMSYISLLLVFVAHQA